MTWVLVKGGKVKGERKKTRSSFYLLPFTFNRRAGGEP